MNWKSKSKFFCELLLVKVRVFNKKKLTKQILTLDTNNFLIINRSVYFDIDDNTNANSTTPK